MGLNRIIYIEGLKEFIQCSPTPCHTHIFLLCHDFANIVAFCFLCLALPEDSGGCLFLFQAAASSPPSTPDNAQTCPGTDDLCGGHE